MHSRLASPLEDLAVGARFLWSLPAFLRHPIGVEQARTILRRRLERREADFLALAGRAIYANPASPYRYLLRLAGCERGDLERLVAADGVDGALRVLCRQGVYLTVEEFKGRRPAVRGSATLRVAPYLLRNPMLTPHLVSGSSGSRGQTHPVMVHLAFIRDRAVDLCLYLEARGERGWLHAEWGVPGGAAMTHILEYAGCGRRPVRWFSQLDPSAPGLHPRYRWSARAMRWGSLLAGRPLPSPMLVPLAQPLPIARWLSKLLRAGRTPHLYTFPSSAVAVCRHASGAAVDIRGARFSLVGEPITAARLAAIRRVGAEAMPAYGSVDCGRIGYGCLAPAAPDEVHLLHDLLALIQPEPTDGSATLPPRALLITSLRPTALLILLNVSLGDEAGVAQRTCGCPLEQFGWRTHLHTIRSVEKLTAGGMTFLGTDVVRVLEEVLPDRFGGGPTDYQLVEDEAEGGQPRLRLLVHPRLGSPNQAAVADAFLTAIGAGNGAERVMALQWRQSGVLQVEHRPPLSTPSGKILHLHQERTAAAHS